MTEPLAIRAPFAGHLSLAVRAGERVTAGTRLGTVEAVKMDVELRAPADGTVRRPEGATPDQVRGGDTVLFLLGD